MQGRSSPSCGIARAVGVDLVPGDGQHTDKVVFTRVVGNVRCLLGVT